MHRINTSGSVEGMFVRGTLDPVQAPTLLGADWPNAVQEEICKVIEHETGGGAELDEENNGQLLAAIQTMVSSAVTALAPVVTTGSGWVKKVHFDGWIEMWVRGSTEATGVDTPQTVNFPSAFPTACVEAIVTTEISSSSDHADAMYQRVGLPTTAGVTVLRQTMSDDDDRSTTPVIYAIGY